MSADLRRQFRHRIFSDFEYEFQMSMMNRNLSEEVETFFLMTGVNYSFISSSIVKEVMAAGGGVSGLVFEPVERKLNEKFFKDAAAGMSLPRIVRFRRKAKIDAAQACIMRLNPIGSGV